MSLPAIGTRVKLITPGEQFDQLEGVVEETAAAGTYSRDPAIFVRVDHSIFNYRTFPFGLDEVEVLPNAQSDRDTTEGSATN